MAEPEPADQEKDEGGVSQAPAYCDAIIAALSEIGYPPTALDNTYGSRRLAVAWDPPPPREAFDKALKICRGPDVSFLGERWSPECERLIIATNRTDWDLPTIGPPRTPIVHV